MPVTPAAVKTARFWFDCSEIKRSYEALTSSDVYRRPLSGGLSWDFASALVALGNAGASTEAHRAPGGQHGAAWRVARQGTSGGKPRQISEHDGMTQDWTKISNDLERLLKLRRL